MIERIAEHSLDSSLLTPGCNVLDVGCLGFAFGDELRRRYKANVYEVDIGDLGPSRRYYRCGIAATDGFGDVIGSAPDARQLTPGILFPVHTIESFSQRVKVPYWDVIKLDCEGSEYDILWNLQKPPATQITVEFHQHTEARRTETFIEQLVDKLGQWYEVRRHKLEGRTRFSLNWWDSLFVLKSP
jgi:Methyltransferase FkbM domain